MPFQVIPAEPRFWERVQKTDTCWLWEGTRSINGYGQICVDGARWSTHRFAYALLVGPIPKGELVCHKCDVKNCVRPDHLFLGTYTDNNRDCAAKGRNASQTRPGLRRRPKRPEAYRAKGEKIACAKLTDEKVREIRRLRAQGIGIVALGKQFGVDSSQISRISNRKIWRHVL